MDNLYSARQVAAKLGVTVQHVRRLAARLKVGRKVDGRLVFRDADVAILRQRRTGAGRPRKQERPHSLE